MAVPIPDAFRDLLDDPVVVALVTVMDNGQPQATPVWADYDGTYVRVNTARGRQKDRNMRQNSKVTILAIDPEDTGRWLEIRGQIAAETEDGALEHINALSALYDGQPDFYANNPDLRGRQQRVIYKIEPLKV
ncbi:MAG: TIGR03618 family F420-dependent PPOX class oxidoreductase, partial [Anaerolineae bacterium]|nr:TIGR03618 family F420-dependent PPOX class oxidoreductase [Anaerolineae bacterium]